MECLVTEFGYMVIGPKAGSARGRLPKETALKTLKEKLIRGSTIFKFFLDNQFNKEELKKFWKHLYSSIKKNKEKTYPKKVDLLQSYDQTNGSVTLVGPKGDIFKADDEYAFDYLATYILFRMYAEIEWLKKHLSDSYDLQNAFEALKEASTEAGIVDGTFTKETNKELIWRLFNVITWDIAKTNDEISLEYFNLLLGALGHKKEVKTIARAKQKLRDFQYFKDLTSDFNFDSSLLDLSTDF